MRVIVPILLLSGFVAGCGMDAKPDSPEPEATPKVELQELPSYAPATRFGLIRNGATLQVGDNADKGLTIFERPDRATSIGDLPDGWPRDYRARGWQSDKESFGMVLRGDTVVGALITQEDVTEKRVTEIVDDYTRLLGEPNSKPQTVNVRYWIWETAPYRCAVCATKNAKSQLVVTVGMGFIQVMDTLGMSPTAAEADSQRAEKILSAPTGG